MSEQLPGETELENRPSVEAKALRSLPQETICRDLLLSASSFGFVVVGALVLLVSVQTGAGFLLIFLGGHGLPMRKVTPCRACPGDRIAH